MTDTINVQDANEWLGQVTAEARDLVNVLKGGIDVGQSGALGDLALVDTLSSAPMGDAATLRTAIGFAAASLVEMQKYGIGSNSSKTPTLFPISDLDADPTSVSSGIYQAFASFTGYPLNASSSLIFTRYNSSSATMLLIENSGSSPKMAYRSYYSGWGNWIYVYGTGNTTVDSNGFIKSASPIFRLANVAEDASGNGFTLDGCGAYNGEAQGVTASHDDVGVYTVTGSLGFAADGWTIEIPQDVNGNRLCFVKTETADDGSITVRTFQRRFDYETAMIVAGDPIDIPDGRWIDLRLKMPAPDHPYEPDAGDDASAEE